MEAETKTVSKRGLVVRMAILIFCLLITGVVAYVLFGDYEPEQNSVEALSSVVMDILCLILLYILTISIAFGEYEKNQTTKLFLCLLLATIWAVFLDFLNWAYDGSLDFDGLTYWFTVGSLCMGALLGCLFAQYLYSYMLRTHNLTEIHTVARICAITDVVSFFVTFTLALTKTAFSFTDGHYKTGALYDVVTAIPVLALIVLTVATLRHVKKVGYHDVLSAAGYFLFMIAGALLEGEYSIGTTYVAVTLADIFIFVMLQNEIIALEKRNVEKWILRSNTDELTQFFNRHAYEKEMTDVGREEIKDNFVYASIDVNGLKMTNDSLGHSAGDEMIIGVAECLKQCFGAYGKLFRIGGDEFVALIYADDTQLGHIKTDFEEVTRRWSGKLVEKLSVSCGYVSARELEQRSAEKMAILADKRMYEAKAHYYQTTGIERRRNSL